MVDVTLSSCHMRMPYIHMSAYDRPPLPQPAEYIVIFHGRKNWGWDILLDVALEYWWKRRWELKLHQAIVDIRQLEFFIGSVTHPWKGFLRRVTDSLSIW